MFSIIPSVKCGLYILCTYSILVVHVRLTAAGLGFITMDARPGR